MAVGLDDLLFPGGVSSAFVEQLFRRYVEDPQSVDPTWQAFFRDLGDDARSLISASGKGRNGDWRMPQDADILEALTPGYVAPRPKKPGKKTVSESDVQAATLDSIRVLMMIRAYRVRGHLMAHLDPLGLVEEPPHPELDPESYGFTEKNFDRPIFIDNVLGLETASVREILAILRRTYCSTVGVEFMHIFQPEEKSWIQAKIEGREKEIQFTPEGKRAILKKLTEAEAFEQFLARKYVGTKRFGLDGAESLIPAMEAIVKTGGHMGLQEMVLGMPHRGRLNVLVNFLQKPFRAVFHEFHGGSYHPDDVQGSGDVKYHLGTSSDREFDGNLVHLSLTANPSHLEAVDPVVLGKVRAKMVQRNDRQGNSVMPVLLHGDAAFAGQGLVAECLGLMGLKGYRTGGTVHIIVNNQIGFTTAPSYSRSSPYPSDVAKAVQAPIFHVNGDDPEAVVYVTKLATEYRQTFHKDVVVDMFCYRRFGHNEGDEPAFTQPIMYQRIRNQSSTREIYAKRLIAEGVITADEAQAMRAEFDEVLEKDFEASTSYKPNKADWLEGRWSGLGLPDVDRRAQTGVPIDSLRDIGHAILTVPEGFDMHRTLKRNIEARARMIDTGEGIDWSTAESLAYGTLVKEGFRVRLSGQDSQRGTFSQRHSVWIDQKTEERYVPLNALTQNDLFEVHDSSLSEAGVLGFEYGFSLAEPNALVLWEGQFGDFANGAQVIIDQFITSAERKWLRMSGLVMLLPHGYEGQGPEHSSARLERYLQMCAEDNIQVANVTTPANYYHILRRQMHRNFRKPLIIMTPKSLLRHKRAVSYLTDMGPGTQFHRVLRDHAELQGAERQDLLKLKPDAKIKRVVLCSGKVYYDLIEAREEGKQDDTYILRVEQLYPFPQDAVVKILSRFTNLERVVWCQEEPKNMGSWYFIQPYLEEVIDAVRPSLGRPVYAGRDASAATATGLMSRHLKQQAELLEKALTA
ncbi:2-oxoglutarate dehydrogenase E1 component [Govanella unica]|uniref:2-oxoglutarate dehydrogenase E1 component n=1 Tax=Govanella unica TaxID=2975056 RepID=A0A9X3TWB3_9PROT|nr:2-oxoglutarate dehydrogenase E1 component [Govania unica]MDA5192744.1 2-oxoglutarate dehydrogenase E1 component [Govania unica]